MKPEIIYHGRKFRADIRTVADMEPVAYDREWIVRADSNRPAYYMFRDVWKKPSDRELMRKSGIRYDITIIPPMRMGKEFVKTYGHGHPCPPGSRHSYPELYEVLEGEAHYLMQNSGKKVDDVIVIKARKGDSVLVPPDYEHVTINPSGRTLKMANLVAEFTSDYSRIKKMGGSAYFEVAGRKWVKNPAYGEVPDVSFIKPAKTFGSDIYRMIRIPGRLDFLCDPEKAISITGNRM